jgi:hypothetical protein
LFVWLTKRLTLDSKGRGFFVVTFLAIFCESAARERWQRFLDSDTKKKIPVIYFFISALFLIFAM